MINKLNYLLVLAALWLNTGRVLGQQSNQELIKGSQTVKLKLVSAIDLGYLFNKSRKVIKEELQINGTPTNSQGYLEVTVYAPTSADIWVPVIKMRRDEQGTTFPTINDISGDEVKRNIEEARTFGIVCKHIEHQSYWTSWLYAGIGAAELAGAAALFVGGGFLEIATAGAATPVAYAMVVGSLYLGSLGVATEGAAIGNTIGIYAYNSSINEKVTEYKYHFKDGNEACGMPDPFGNVIVEIVGKSFNLNEIHIPGIPPIYPQNFLIDTQYDVTLATSDGIHLVPYYWRSDPASVWSEHGPMKLLNRLPSPSSSHVYPEMLLGPQNHIPGEVSLTIPSQGYFLILSDPVIFNSTTVLSSLPHEDLGPILVNFKSSQEVGGQNDQAYFYNVYRVYGSPGQAISIDVGEYGPYIFADTFQSTTNYTENEIRMQGSHFATKPLDYLQDLGNGIVNTTDQLASSLVGKNVLDLTSGVSSSVLTIFKPLEEGASLYLIVAQDQVAELCLRMSEFLGASCVSLGRAFPGITTEYEIIRVKDFQLSPESVDQYYQLQVSENGPFVVGAYIFSEQTNQDLFTIIGQDLTHTPSSENGNSAIYPTQWLGTSQDAYQIISMAENYYNLPGVVPTSVVQLSAQQGKAFSEKSEFYVAALPSSMPTDWNATDLGAFFEARQDGGNLQTFHLFRVNNAKGELFEVTIGGPFVVGTDGTLNTSFTQLKNVSVH